VTLTCTLGWNVDLVYFVLHGAVACVLWRRSGNTGNFIYSHVIQRHPGFLLNVFFISLGIHKSMEHNSISKICLSWKLEGLLKPPPLGSRGLNISTVLLRKISDVNFGTRGRVDTVVLN